MRSRRSSATRALVCLLGMLVAPALRAPLAQADGGLVRAREDHGTLTVTLFTSPTPLRVGAADVSVLVQERASRATVLDAEVVVRLEPLDGAGGAASVRLGRQAATNKLLQAGTIALPAAGRFRLVAEVRRGDERVATAVEVEVAAPSPPLLALWPYLALPPVVVGIFLVHQWLRRRSVGTAREILVAARQGRAAR